jgi:hypothetical protein
VRTSPVVVLLALAGAITVTGLAVGCRERADGGQEGPGAADAGEAGYDASGDGPAPPGVVLVQAFACGQCHQSNDAGDGVLSGQSTPVPGSAAYGSNLTPDPDTGMDAWDAGTIAKSILAAVDEQGKPLCPQMPAYADAGMTYAEALAVAAYLQGLPAVWHPVPASACRVSRDAGP